MIRQEEREIHIMKNIDFDENENFKPNVQNIETQADEISKGV